MTKDKFFEEQTDQSKIKAIIVSDYFWSWAKIMLTRSKVNHTIAYVDLFCGPGKYDNRKESTPILVLKKIISERSYCDRIKTIFNDKDKEHIDILKETINNLPGIEKVKYKPILKNSEVNTEFILNLNVPTLYFIDPCGYKGLSFSAIIQNIKGWGCECIFFFNYNRINAALENPFMEKNMSEIFGEYHAKNIISLVVEKNPQERELTILEYICQIFLQSDIKFVLPFCFKNEDGYKTSHHLIFVSKNVLGYKIMKEIMAGQSTQVDQGVASFEYNPATKNQPFLSGFNLPLEELEDNLLKTYKGRKMTMNEVYEAHNIGKRFIKKNYKDCLSFMEAKGLIITDPPAEKRRKNTFGDKVKVYFKG